LSGRERASNIEFGCGAVSSRDPSHRNGATQARDGGKMAADHDQSPRKLVYLRDRAPRPRPRVARHDRRPTGQPPADLAGEATWLGRALFVVAAGTIGYWLLALSGAIQPSTSDDLWRSLAGASLAHVFLTACCGIAAVRLFRDAAHSVVVVAAAAGALVLVTLEGLARLVVSGDLSEVSLSVRTQILADAGGLAIGIWAFSYALRLQRRERTA
jgi:hypothetical protein